MMAGSSWFNRGFSGVWEAISHCFTPGLPVIPALFLLKPHVIPVKRRLRASGVRTINILDIPGFKPPLCNSSLCAGFLRRVLSYF